MENKEIKNNAAELNDEVLENVSGGNGDVEFKGVPVCPRCGGTLMIEKENITCDSCSYTVRAVTPSIAKSIPM